MNGDTGACTVPYKVGSIIAEHAKWELLKKRVYACHQSRSSSIWDNKYRAEDRKEIHLRHVHRSLSDIPDCDVHACRARCMYVCSISDKRDLAVPMRATSMLIGTLQTY